MEEREQGSELLRCDNDDNDDDDDSTRNHCNAPAVRTRACAPVRKGVGNDLDERGERDELS